MRTGGGDQLRKAKGGKNDEFYTQRKDIDAELGFYQEKFRGKTVYCNCDDPKISNFVSFFRDNFHKLGLKRRDMQMTENAMGRLRYSTAMAKVRMVNSLVTATLDRESVLNF